MNTAIVAAGYITIDSFQQGADLPNNELTQRNHILRDETTGEYYRWDGDLPKKAPVGSTPQSTGGIGEGAWVSVGDASLRSGLLAIDGQSFIGSTNYSGVRNYTGVNSKITVYGISNIFDGGAGEFVRDDSDHSSVDNGGTVLVDANGKRWKRQFTGLVKLIWFGVSGNDNSDHTSAVQSAVNYAQTMRPDMACEILFPMGTTRVSHISFDLVPKNRFVKFIGSSVPSDLSGSKILFTESATREISMQCDGGFCAENMIFDFGVARSTGTLASPRWGIDIRNTALANSTSDLDCNFDNCTFMNFHRAIRCYGRGISIRGGSVVGGGGAANEGCLLDIDFPNPLEPGNNPEQTLVTGMRAFMIAPDRIHACTGWLVRNKGYNANNMQQITIQVGMSDTFMGWMRGAVKNLTVEGGTFLYPVSTMLYVEDGFDCENVTVKAPTMIGMPETNIGARKGDGSLVTESEVMNFSVGVLLYVSPNARNVRQFSWSGGVISDSSSDLFQFAKAIDGFSFTGVTGTNLCKQNKQATGSVRHVVNFNGTASKNITIKNNNIKNLDMTRVGTLSGNDSLISNYDIGGNLLSGAVFETYTRKKDTNFGGDYSPVYCGQFVGDGSKVNVTRYSAKRYAKCAIIALQGTSTLNARTWMVKDGDVTNDVILSGGTLITKNEGAISDGVYSFTLFF
nr:hypothetical protein [Providencia rettgeri]